MPLNLRAVLLSSVVLVWVSSSSCAAYKTVSGQDPPARFLTKKYETVLGKKMAYVEVGSGDPIVFIHGNPTSSYLWRNIMPHLEGYGRLIAVDLIGMGDSDKLDYSGPDRYTFWEQMNFFGELMRKLDVKENVTLILHDWGSAIGFSYAYHNRANTKFLKGMAFMEAMVTPVYTITPFDLATLEFFGMVRRKGGEEKILNENIFIEFALPDSMFRNLTEKEMNEYRRPYLKAGEDRRVMHDWALQVPVFEEPAAVYKHVSDYSTWLSETPVPKLFINGDPGTLLVGPYRDFAYGLKSLTSRTVRGVHYFQEDSPDEIGTAIAEWLPTIGVHKNN